MLSTPSRQLFSATRTHALALHVKLVWHCAGELHEVRHMPAPHAYPFGHVPPEPLHVPKPSQICWHVAPHGVPTSVKRSTGQFGLMPLQVSGTSQTGAAGRHTVELDAKLSLGHTMLPPSHCSATSQPPSVAARHSVPAGATPFTGHAPPVQVSGTSQRPCAVRHVRPAQSVSAQSVARSPSLSTPSEQFVSD